jgi:hypothetical protein
MRRTTAQPATEELLKSSDDWFKKMAVSVATLKGNPWRSPLMAAWTPESAIQDSELVAKFEAAEMEQWQQENQQRWRIWRGDLRQHLENLRAYLNDRCPDRKPHLEKSRLWRMAHLPDTNKGFVERRNYSRDECLVDIQSVIDLVMAPGKPDHDPFSRLRQKLQKAIDETDRATARKEIGINRDTLDDFLSGKKRSPQRETVRKIKEYVMNHSARSGK